VSTTSSTTTPLRRRATLAAAGLTVSLLGANVVTADAASAAGKANVKASISLSKNSEDLLGKVKSRKKVCKKKVQVVLYWLEQGEKKFVPVAEDLTNKKGKWSINTPSTKNIPPGKYYVKLASSKNCKGEKSKTIRVS